MEPFSFDSVPASAGKGLSAKDKWRIPIVLAKVVKGRTLNRRDSKIWDACDTLFADGDFDTLGSARFSTASMTNGDMGSVGGFSASSKSQRWTAAPRPFAAPSQEDNQPPRQPNARRKSSFSSGYEAIISSLQRGLGMMQNTSRKSSKVATGSADRAGEGTVGSLPKPFTAATAGSGESKKGGGWKQSASTRGGTMMQRAASRRKIDAASPKSVTADTTMSCADNSGAVLDAAEEEEISHCERANRELRAARYFALLAANTAAAAAAAANDSSATPPPQTASGMSVKISQKPASIRMDAPITPSAKTGLKSEKAQSPSMKFALSSDSAKSSISALLHPVLRLIEVVTRRSLSAVAAEG